jgi:hypothetical protein
MNKRRTVVTGGLSIFGRSLFGQKISPEAPTGPVPFGYQMAWLAVKTVKPVDLVSYLGMDERRQVNWAQGIQAVYDRKEMLRATLVFVTPPVEGWTLVVGWWTLPDDRHSLENIARMVKDLSSAFGETQGFASYQIPEYHHWILAVNGNVERSFAYIGERGEVWANSGTITEAERGSGTRRYPSINGFQMGKTL